MPATRRRLVVGISITVVVIRVHSPAAVETLVKVATPVGVLVAEALVRAETRSSAVGVVLALSSSDTLIRVPCNG